MHSIYRIAVLIIILPLLAFGLRTGVSGEGNIGLFNPNTGPAAFICPLIEFDTNNELSVRVGLGYTSPNSEDTLTYIGGRKARIDFGIGLEYRRNLIHFGETNIGIATSATYIRYIQNEVDVVSLMDDSTGEFRNRIVYYFLPIKNIEGFFGIFFGYVLNKAISVYAKIGLAVVYSFNSYRIDNYWSYTGQQKIETVKNNDAAVSIRTTASQIGIKLYF